MWGGGVGGGAENKLIEVLASYRQEKEEIKMGKNKSVFRFLCLAYGRAYVCRVGWDMRTGPLVDTHTRAHTQAAHLQ